MFQPSFIDAGTFQKAHFGPNVSAKTKRKQRLPDRDAFSGFGDLEPVEFNSIKTIETEVFPHNSPQLSDMAMALPECSDKPLARNESPPCEVKTQPKCFVCGQLKYKNSKPKLLKLEQVGSVWCHSLCKKVHQTRLSRTNTVASKTSEPNNSAIPNLSEVLAQGGKLGLHNYHGPFVYTHLPY